MSPVKLSPDFVKDSDGLMQGVEPYIPSNECTFMTFMKRGQGKVIFSLPSGPFRGCITMTKVGPDGALLSQTHVSSSFWIEEEAAQLKNAKWISSRGGYCGCRSCWNSNK
jgi:hypothetical protein